MFLKQRVFFIAGFNEAENPFIIREDEYSKPLPPPPPVPRPSPVRPRPPSSASINLVAGTAESVSPYGNNDRSDGLTAPVITIGKFISVGQINTLTLRSDALPLRIPSLLIPSVFLIGNPYDCSSYNFVLQKMFPQILMNTFELWPLLLKKLKSIS